MKFICRIAEINRSSYYAWLKRPTSKREAENATLLEGIRASHKQSKGIYGAPRITSELNSDGLSCGRNRVARLMRKEGIFGCAKKKFRAISTTNSRHDMPISPRLFKIEEKEALPSAQNEVWVGDITYIPTGEGWLFLTAVMDLFNRKIVGYSMSDNLRSESVWEAMKAGIQHQPHALDPAKPTLIAHSDRGSQYASEYYRGKLALCGITQSMSRSGNCYDNAYAESFFHTLKVELVHRHQFGTRTEARKEVEEYIDWYNCKRLHSGLGYKTPISYGGNKIAA
jgi:putative transposase